jgi:hypothetical protein
MMFRIESRQGRPDISPGCNPGNEQREYPSPSGATDRSFRSEASVAPLGLAIPRPPYPALAHGANVWASLPGLNSEHHFS